MHHIAGLRDELSTLQTKFVDRYGTFDININDGTINRAPRDSNKEENVEADKKD